MSGFKFIASILVSHIIGIIIYPAHATYPMVLGSGSPPESSHKGVTGWLWWPVCV